MEIFKYWISKGNLLITNKRLQMPSIIIFFLQLTGTKYNTHNKIGTNKHISSTHLNFLSQISENLFPVMGFKFVSTKEIANVMKSLKSNNCHGYEEVSTKLLKISASYICSPLTYICSESILGIFPNCLKYSIIKSLYKKGDK